MQSGQSAIANIIQQIRTEHAAVPQQVYIVGIDGGGGAGKSTLAKYLSKLLNETTIVHVDDFISGANPLPDWWKRINVEVLEPLSEGQRASYLAYNRQTHVQDHRYFVEPQGIVILEGFGSLRPEYRAYLNFSIWIQASEAIRFERGLERHHEGRAQWTKWLKSDQAYVEMTQPDKAADIIIDGTKSYL